MVLTINRFRWSVPGSSVSRAMVAWTIVVMVIFLEHVWQTLAMPVLSEYMLTLMGMSAGTYVGMKASEVNTPPK